MAEQEKRSRRGCLAYLGVVVALAAVVAIAAAWAGMRYSRRIVRDFTFDQPMTVSGALLTPDEQRELTEHASDFSAGLDRGKAEPLALTVAEANALIASDTNLVSLRNHFEVSAFAPGQISGALSFPAEQLALTPLRGRFINATGTFSVEVRSNQIQLNAVSLSTPSGRPFPSTFNRAIQMHNLATDLNVVPEITNALGRIKSVGVGEGKLLITPKR